MEQPRPQSTAPESAADLDAFFSDLRKAAQRLLLLDYDGTLAPFHVHPPRAVPYEGVCELLDRIMRDAASDVVIVSGRPARDLRPLLRLRRPPTIWGSHGWEYLNSDGDYRCGPVDSQPIRQALQDDAWVREIKDLGGRFERKPASIAIHWRGLAPMQIAQIHDSILNHALAHNFSSKLQWIDFDGGVELRLSGRDKGFVVETLLTAYPKAATAYLGDDLVDEDAFRAIKGRGLGVLVRPKYRPTFAQAWLRPPEQLLDFLERWAAAGGRGRL